MNCRKYKNVFSEHWRSAYTYTLKYLYCNIKMSSVNAGGGLLVPTVIVILNWLLWRLEVVRWTTVPSTLCGGENWDCCPFPIFYLYCSERSDHLIVFWYWWTAFYQGGVVGKSVSTMTCLNLFTLWRIFPATFGEFSCSKFGGFFCLILCIFQIFSAIKRVQYRTGKVLKG